jgi:AAA domain-containing protein
MKGPEASLTTAVESYADIRAFGPRTERVLRETVGIIAEATSDDRLAALKSAAQTLAKEVRDGWIDRPSAADRVYNAAVAYGVVNAHGDDAVQAILGAAFAQPAAHQTPQSNTQAANAELDAKIFELDRRPRWRRGAVLASELQGMTFAPIRYVLPGYIPEGVTLLAGKPKVGKSWLVLDLCIAVAAGRFTLGTIKPMQGNVLYLALEDNRRRLKKRIAKLLSSSDPVWPDRLTLQTEWKRADDGGLSDIEEWCNFVPQPTLIVVDTLEKIRPLQSGKAQAYTADYQAITGLQKIAGERGLAIVINHHLRKMEADDPFDTISGTLGLTGAADTILVLKRQSGGITLYARGRDIEESETALQFDKGTCKWTMLGPDAVAAGVSNERAKIIGALQSFVPAHDKDGMAVSEIMAATEATSRNALDILLHKMRVEGQIIRVRRGVYLLPSDSGKIGQKERNATKLPENPQELGNLSNLSDLSSNGFITRQPSE